MSFFFFFFFLFAFSRAAPTIYGGSQARGQIGAVAASLHHKKCFFFFFWSEMSLETVNADLN